MKSNNFFKSVSKELAKRVPKGAEGQVLTIDENMAIHLPVSLLARYDLDADVEAFWDNVYGVFAIGFVKKPGEDVQSAELDEGGTVAIDLAPYFAAWGVPIGKLPARFAYVVKSLSQVVDYVVEPSSQVIEGNYPGPCDELVVVALQWRQK